MAVVSAADTVRINDGKVVLLTRICRGNSTKATRGINGAATKTQATLGIPDSVELFTSDTPKDGAKETR